MRSYIGVVGMKLWVTAKLGHYEVGVYVLEYIYI